MTLSVTVQQIQEMYPRVKLFQSITQAEVDAWLVELRLQISERAWGADRALAAAIHAVAHCIEMADRAERDAGRVGASTAKTMGAQVTESYSVPSPKEGDGPWMGTVYGQRFLSLRKSNPRLRLPRVGGMRRRR